MQPPAPALQECQHCSQHHCGSLGVGLASVATVGPLLRRVAVPGSLAIEDTLQLQPRHTTFVQSVSRPSPKRALSPTCSIEQQEKTSGAPARRLRQTHRSAPSPCTPGRCAAQALRPRRCRRPPPCSSRLQRRRCAIAAPPPHASTASGRHAPSERWLPSRLRFSPLALAGLSALCPMSLRYLPAHLQVRGRAVGSPIRSSEA